MMKEIGRYLISSQIGTGRMGKVYRGVTSSGRSVAIKIVHPHLLSQPGFFRRFLHEAQQSSKVKHPNVVRTVDVGAATVDGEQTNYLVMEFVDGKSLSTLREELGTVPETLLREIALQFTAGLRAIHEAGIVHRDLKPENVLISRNQNVRIMDVGVAGMQEASVALSMGGQFAGSYQYAAPELFQADADVGPAADLYSLGVILFELATGENPFHSSNPISVMKLHEELEPPGVRDLAPQVSAFFSEIVRTLLAKAPADRFASAEEVNRILDSAELSDWWRERERDLREETTQLPEIRVRRDCALHGRHTEMKALTDAWESAKLGQGSVLLFEGEAGIGKTRLLSEFANQAALDDAHILYGAYTPGGGIGGLSEAIIQKFGSVNLAEGIAPYVRETPTLVGSFAALVKHESPPPGAAPLPGDALHSVGVHLFRNLSEDKPSLWLIDDVHFAPEESVNFLVAFARALSKLRVLLVLTARSGDLGGHMEHFALLDRFRRHDLGRLSPHEVSEMLRETLRSDSLVQRLGSRIAEKSDGVPLFVLEIARTLQDAGPGEDVDVEVPSAVRELIGARLRDLSDEERNLLDCASVQGFTFDADLVARALEEKPIVVLQRLAALERRLGIVHAHGSGHRFDHHQVQEILYSEQADVLRASYHGLIADALETRSGLADAEEPDAGAAYAVALHRLRSTNPAAAKRYLKPALSHVDNEYRTDAYIQLCDLALDAKGLLSDEERCRVLTGKGSKHGHLGHRARQGASLEEAVSIADRIDDLQLRCEARGQLGWYLWAVGRYPEAQSVLEESLELVEDDEQRTRLAGRLAAVLSTMGLQEEALALDPPSANNRGLIHQYLGNYAEALTCFQTAVEEETGEGAAPVAMLNVGRIQAALGDPESARVTLTEASTILKTTGLRRAESYGIQRLGAVAEQMGNPAEAERLYTQALALRREIDYPSGVAESLLAIGCLRKAQGKDASSILREAQKVSRDIDRPDEFVLTSVHLGGGISAEAALKSHGPRMRVRERMEAHYELWRLNEKREHLEEARRLHAHLLEHAPEGSREAMVEFVPIHADIEAAWKECGDTTVGG
jgi:tetratricopeptide (TPR) repeat protein